MGKPTIDVGDAIAKSKLPAWLRWFLGLFRGAKISAGPIDIKLHQNDTIPPTRSGLDQPHRIEPPQIGPRR